jgi:hypothetical protein
LSKKIPIYKPVGLTPSNYKVWIQKAGYMSPDPSAAPGAPVRKKPKRKVGFKAKGVSLVPMTEAVAMSLDAADEIKYIGKVDGQHFHHFRRNVFKLVQKPTFDLVKKKLAIKTSLNYYGTTVHVPLRDIALVARGDANAKAYNRAARFIPARLKRIKNDLMRLVEESKKRTDEYLEDLPLHKKLELFKSFTLEEQQLYDFLYRDVQEVFHPKEEEAKPEAKPTDGTT